MTELEEIIEKLKTNPASKVHGDYGLTYKGFMDYLSMNAIKPLAIRQAERRRVILAHPEKKEAEICEMLNCDRCVITQTKRKLRSEGYTIPSFSNNPVTYFG